MVGEGLAEKTMSGRRGGTRAVAHGDLRTEPSEKGTAPVAGVWLASSGKGWEVSLARLSGGGGNGGT